MRKKNGGGGIPKLGGGGGYLIGVPIIRESYYLGSTFGVPYRQKQTAPNGLVLFDQDEREQQKKHHSLCALRAVAQVHGLAGLGLRVPDSSSRLFRV